mmetsp:Transcript_28216/g.45916  ORF Transcript_28216/g.45916 Transcript_28216/m.45916 type:complete len:795 (+) Transcript_28216:78-2462(+)
MSHHNFTSILSSPAKSPRKRGGGLLGLAINTKLSSPRSIADGGSTTNAAVKREQKGFRALITATATERDGLQTKLKERHEEMLQLLEALDRKKSQCRTLTIKNREQGNHLTQSLEKIEILNSENLHLRQTSEQEAKATAKHVALLKQQVCDRAHEIKLLERSVADLRKDSADQKQVYESRISAQEKQYSELEGILQSRIDELSDLKTTSRARQDQLSEKLAKSQAEVATLNGEIRALQDVRENNQELEKALGATRSRVEHQAEELVKATEARAHVAGELKLSRKQAETAADEVKRLSAALSDAKHALSAGMAEAESKMRAALAESERANHEAMEKAEARRAAEESTYFESIRRVEAEKRVLETKVAAMEELRHRNSELKESFQNLQSELKQTVTKMQTEGLSLREEVRRLAAGKAEIEGEHRVRAKALETLEKQAAELRSQLGTLRSKCAAVEADNRELRSRSLELERKRDAAVLELATRVSRNEQERLQSQGEFTRVFGDLKHNQCLAQELAKRLEIERAAAERLLEQERAATAQTIAEKIAERKAEMEQGMERMQKKTDHFRKCLDRLSSRFAKVHRKQHGQHNAEVWVARWQALVYRRKYLRCLWYKILRRVKRKAIVIANDGNDYADDDFESGVEEKEGAVADGRGGRAQPQQPSELVRGNNGLGVNYYKTLRENMDNVGRLLQRVDARQPERGQRELAKGYEDLESAIERYHSFLSSKDENSDGQAVDMEKLATSTREIEAFEAESMQLSRSVTDLIHAVGAGRITAGATTAALLESRGGANYSKEMNR